MIADLERCFDPAPLPNWFYAFEENRQKAIDDLLFGRFPMDSLNTVDPEDLLIDWANLVDSESDFPKQLDQGLEQWVKDNWGKFPNVSAGRLALAWCRLADVVAFVEGLEGVAASLLERFDEREQYLGALSDGPSRDALGRYLFAIARYQKDRRLAAFWWQLCDLRGATPYYHGRAAIAGLRGLPAPDSLKGGFRTDVAAGLLKLGRAVDRLVSEGVLSRATAEEFFLSVSWHTVAAYPPRSAWRQLLAHAVKDASERLSTWLTKVLPDIDKPLPKVADRTAGTARFNPEWPHRAQQLETRLKASPQLALQEAEELIAEQRAFAQASGEGIGLAATLCTLSRGIRGYDAARAAEWAEEAKNWEPSDPRSWSHWIKGLQMSGETSTALAVAWDALERFPEDAFVPTDLAQLLMVANRLPEAEQVAVESVERFPNNEHSWGILATVLRRTEKYSEAEVVCRRALSRFRTNYRWWMDLALVLVLQGKIRDAEAELRSATKRFPNEVFLWNFLGGVLSREGRLSDSEDVLRTAATRFGDKVAKISLAGAIRHQGPNRLEEALSIVEEVLQADSGNVYALAEKAGILEDMGRFEEASLIFETVRREHPDFEVQEPDLVADLLAADTAWQETDKLEGPAAGEQPPTKVAEPALGEPKTADSEKTIVSFDLAADLPSNSASDVKRDSTHVPEHGPRRTVSVLSVAKRGQWELVAKISEARLLRKWARRNEITNESPSPAELRRKSGLLLEDVLSRAPNHPRACVEWANLLIESGSLQEAHSFLEGKIALMLSVPGLRQALARANRELAKQQRLQFDQERYAILTNPLLQLQRRNPAFQPLADLGRGRICLAMHDGHALRQAAAKDFDHLRAYIGERPEGDGKFRVWWSEQIHNLLFSNTDHQTPLTVDDIKSVDQALQASGNQIDVLEEDFTIRMSL